MEKVIEFAEIGFNIKGTHISQGPSNAVSAFSISSACSVKLVFLAFSSALFML